VNLAELVLLAANSPGTRTLNCGDMNPPSVAQISAVVDGLMNWSTERVLVSGPPPEPTVGDHPWTVPRPVVADMSLARSELGYREAKGYADALADTLAWVPLPATKRIFSTTKPRMRIWPKPDRRAGEGSGR
jgi:nucleoside-diphosphate-sugar epimerase